MEEEHEVELKNFGGRGEVELKDFGGRGEVQLKDFGGRGGRVGTRDQKLCGWRIK